MTAPVPDLLSQMADIKGLDRISWWPLALGWWAVLATVAAGLAVVIAFKIRRRRFAQSWRGDADRKLAGLEEKLNAANGRDVLAELSVLIRQIAVHRYSRAECAGLEGQAWLTWLQAHDPRHFAWTEAGMPLLNAPYAPPGTPVAPDTVKPLLAAARLWVA